MRKIINQYVEIEELAGRVYIEFAKSDTCCEELKMIWQEMAKDEEDHAMQLKFALRFLREGSFEGFSGGTINIDKAKAILDEAYNKSHINALNESEMVEYAVAIERELMKVHAANSLSFQDPNMLKLFKGLARADEEHVRKLQAYIKRHDS